MTDAWVKPGSVWSRLPGDLPQRLSERFHPELADADVRAFTLRLMAREALWRSQPSAGWDQLMKRNRWFGRRAAAALQRLPNARAARTVVFAHSYSARDVFTHARSRGWTTVFGQIDPGAEHFRIVGQAAVDRTEFGGAPDATSRGVFRSLARRVQARRLDRGELRVVARVGDARGNP